jgi:hypothetical protein
MIFIYIVGGLVALAFIILLSLFLNTRKAVREHIKVNTDQASRHADLAMKFNRQLEVRHDAIKKLLGHAYNTETQDFFKHMTDPSSHIPDSVFEKVEAYQNFITKRKKDE